MLDARRELGLGISGGVVTHAPLSHRRLDLTFAAQAVNKAGDQVAASLSHTV